MRWTPSCHIMSTELVAGRLQFCIYHFHEWPDYTLFLIPIDFAEKLHGEIKKSHWSSSDGSSNTTGYRI